MRAGPKGELTAGSLDLSGYPAGRAARRLRFIADHVVVPKGVGAREPVDLRAFQREFIESAYAPGIRTGLLSIPRANGKSALGAMLAVAELFVNDAPLVLVDDEISTGATALDSIRALHGLAPHRRYVVASLVDLRSPEQRHEDRMERRMHRDRMERRMMHRRMRRM